MDLSPGAMLGVPCGVTPSHCLLPLASQWPGAERWPWPRRFWPPFAGGDKVALYLFSPAPNTAPLRMRYLAYICPLSSRPQNTTPRPHLKESVEDHALFVLVVKNKNRARGT